MVTTNRITWVSILASACAVRTQCPRSARISPRFNPYMRRNRCMSPSCSKDIMSRGMFTHQVDIVFKARKEDKGWR